MEVTGKSRRPVMKILLGSRPSKGSYILARITEITREARYIYIYIFSRGYIARALFRLCLDSTKFLYKRKKKSLMDGS